MGSQTILLICIALSAIEIVYGKVWEFGSDNIPDAKIISKFNGKFPFFKKELEVQLDVPPCYIVTYVNVKVNNAFATPTVYYNFAKNTVLISYSLWQYSRSTYAIYVKGIWKPGCYGQPHVPQVHDHNSPQRWIAPQGQFGLQNRYDGLSYDPRWDRSNMVY